MNLQLIHLPILVALLFKPAQCQLPGPPDNPEYFSAMSAVWQQVPREPPQPAPRLKGTVSELIWEKFQVEPSDRAKATNLLKRLVIRYDDKQREVERTESPDARGIETKTVSVYQKWAARVDNWPVFEKRQIRRGSLVVALAL